MAEAVSPPTRAAYRRWHAWAAFYLAGLQSRQGRLSAALATSVSALGRDPLAPFRLVPQLIRHVAERQARKGRPHGQALRQVPVSTGRAAVEADGPPRSLGDSPGPADAAKRAGRIIGK